MSETKPPHSADAHNEPVEAAKACLVRQPWRIREAQERARVGILNRETLCEDCFSHLKAVMEAAESQQETKMPTLRGIRERFDNPIYDTELVEPGQNKRFFHRVHNRGDITRTNMQYPGQFPGDSTYIIGGIGLRLVGKSQEEEDLLLDHLFATVILGDKPYGPYPGNLCSTSRLLLESEEDAERHSRNAEKLGIERGTGFDRPMRLIPGYCLLRPLVIPVRQAYCVEVAAAEELPEAVTVRVILLGLRTRDSQ